MEGGKTIWFKLFREKEVTLVNKNVIMFAFFLFVAFIFWYINSLGKEVKGEFRFTTNFVNIPKGKEISDELPLKMILEIQGQGYSLLKYKLYGNGNKLSVDLSKTGLKRLPEAKPTRYYVLTSSLLQNLRKQLGNGFDILAVKPDTIFFSSAKD